MIGSSYTYIETFYVCHEYITVLYSSYITFYSDFFTIINQDESQSKDINNTIIISVCSAIAAILVVTILIVLLIRMQNNKISSDEIDENEMSGNNFQTTFSTHNIEEDPFAKDFKEDEYFGNI